MVKAAMLRDANFASLICAICFPASSDAAQRNGSSGEIQITPRGTRNQM